jgi:phage head maturation protease
MCEMQLFYTKALSLVDSQYKNSADGVFSGYAATTGNVDLGNDIIIAGAFSDWLKSADASRVRGTGSGFGDIGVWWQGRNWRRVLCAPA